MKNLFSYSVYQELSDISPDLEGLFGRIRCDGLELLTSHTPVDPSFAPYTKTVHLPYTTDWLCAWEGRPYDMPEEYVRYYMYGRDREEIADTVRNMIWCAEPLHPAHGVIHACNIDIPELRLRSYSKDSKYVLEKFCDMINTVASGFPGGEPPFKLVFENLWWPGLRMKDSSDYHLMSRKLEFENWGICLDTGHLMNTIPGLNSESDCIDVVNRIIDGYSTDVIDTISAMHFHYSASGDYRANFEEVRCDTDDIMGFIRSCYHHINTLDQHLPFSDPRCREIVDRIGPENLIHELPGRKTSPIEDYVQQRSLFD